MNDLTSIAVVGCGDVAIQRHLPTVTASPIVRLAAVCDSDPERVERAMVAFGPVRGTTEYTEILDDPDIDGVIIATPPWVSHQLTIAALKAGKDVLCEKPMALTVEQAQAVLDTERGTDRFVQIGFVLRHGPLFGALRRWISDGRLGTPLDFRISVFDEVWNPSSDPNHYHRILSTLEHGAPCIHDGAHTMDHLHFLLNCQAIRLSSWGTTSRPEFPRPNYNVAMIEFEHGHRARVEIGWFMPTFPSGEWNIIGPDGIASFFQHEARVEFLGVSGNETVSIDDDWIESCFRYQLDTFVRAIHSRVPPVPGSADGLASLILCQHVEEGMATPFVSHEVRYP